MGRDSFFLGMEPTVEIIPYRGHNLRLTFDGQFYRPVVCKRLLEVPVKLDRHESWKKRRQAIQSAKNFVKKGLQWP